MAMSTRTSGGTRNDLLVRPHHLCAHTTGGPDRPPLLPFAPNGSGFEIFSNPSLLRNDFPTKFYYIFNFYKYCKNDKSNNKLFLFRKKN